MGQILKSVQEIKKNYYCTYTNKKIKNIKPFYAWIKKKFFAINAKNFKYNKYFYICNIYLLYTESKKNYKELINCVDHIERYKQKYKRLINN